MYQRHSMSREVRRRIGMQIVVAMGFALYAWSRPWVLHFVRRLCAAVRQPMNNTTLTVLLRALGVMILDAGEYKVSVRFKLGKALDVRSPLNGMSAEVCKWFGTFGVAYMVMSAVVVPDDGAWPFGRFARQQGAAQHDPRRALRWLPQRVQRHAALQGVPHCALLPLTLPEKKLVGHAVTETVATAAAATDDVSCP